MSARVPLLFAALLSCVSACAGSAPSPVTGPPSLLGGAVAREVQRDAPEAWASVLEAQARVRATPEPLRGLASDSVGLELEAAAAAARSARARRRIAQAERELGAVGAELGRVQSSEEEARRALAAAAAGQRSRESVGAVAGSPVRDALVQEQLQRASFFTEAAALLGAPVAQVEALRARLAEARGPRPPARGPTAAQLYAQAEALLASAQGSTPRAQAPERGALVEALSRNGGLEPHAEERGVVMVLRGLFAGSGPRLQATSRGRLETVARILQNYGSLEVRVEALVGGASAPTAQRAATAQAEAVVAELVRAGVPAARLHPAGEHRAGGGRRGDDRVELVLLVPGAP